LGVSGGVAGLQTCNTVTDAQSRGEMILSSISTLDLDFMLTYDSEVFVISFLLGNRERCTLCLSIFLRYCFFYVLMSLLQVKIGLAVPVFGTPISYVLSF
jgi:hypothetical protein